MIFLAAGVSLIAGVALYHKHKALRETIHAAEAKSEVAEIKAKMERRSLDEFSDGLDIIVFLLDPESRILYANKLAKRVFGFDKPEGQEVLSVTLSPKLDQIVKDAIAGSQRQRYDLFLDHPISRHVLAQAWRIESVPDRIVLSLYDVTDLRKLERVRTDFVQNVSHELRTPMTSIRLLVETIQEENPDAIVQLGEDLDKIIYEVDRLTDITRDLLTLTQVETGDIEMSNVDLVSIIQDAIDKLGAIANDKNLELSYEGPDSLSIFANGSQLLQVMINLVDNAMKYTPEGSVRVTLDAIDPKSAVLTIVDTGIGIALEHQPRIFERFYRVDKGRSRAAGGSGLGLSIVKHIVEAHGGTISVDSVLNKGSTFTVTLPTGFLEPDAEEDTDALPEPEEGQQTEPDQHE